MSNELKEKINKIRPLVRVRKIQFDQECFLLAQIQKEKREVLVALKRFEEGYVKGVSLLNSVRVSGDFSQLAQIESSVDYAKSQWMQTMSLLREVEQRERSQIHQTMIAERDFKSMEILRDKYREEYEEFLRKEDLKAMDEVAISRYETNRGKTAWS